MKIALVIAGLIVLGILGIVLFLSRYGLFASINISQHNVGPYNLVYSKHIGDYKDVGPVMDKLYNDLKTNYGITTTKGFGLYYDNPQKVEKEKLRSIVGCIVENKSFEELSSMGLKYQVKEFPLSKGVIAEFPYKAKFSIILGVIRVYPKLSSYIQDNNYAQTPIMELYDQPGEKILYISAFEMPSEVYDEFLH